MKVKVKEKLSRVLSVLLVINMILAGVIATDTYYSLDSDKAYAAGGISTAMGTNAYYGGVVGGATLAAGSTYTFDGCEWRAAEAKDGGYVLVMTKGNTAKGVMGGYWPGYIKNNNSYYTSNMEGVDISSYYAGLAAVYNDIKATENTSATYGKGFYLVPYSKVSGQSGQYWDALKTAAGNYSSFGASDNSAWTGTYDGYYSAYSVNSGGNINGYGQSYSFVVPAAFNLNPSKVRLSGTDLTVATFTPSTGISATQSTQSVEEGATVDLSQVISGVSYVGGDNNGKSAQYTVQVSDGSVSGTKWTAPTGINANTSVTLTITSVNGATFTTTKSVTVTPRKGASITVAKSGSFPDKIASKESIDLAPYLTVTGYDSASQSDGTITSYSMTCDNGTFEGTTYTAGTVDTERNITITVHPTGTLGSVDYSAFTATFEITVKPDTTGWTNRDGNLDEKGFYTYEDKETNITWKYKYNKTGNISYLYTEDNIENIISDGHVLLVPSSINGVSVVGIGGGSKDGDVIPFIPYTGDNINDTWTRIYIPSSVKTINDGAFYANGASADIVIPGTVSEIGVNAFKTSKITSVIFNDATNLKLNTESFAEIPTLAAVAFRGNGITICQRAFNKDTGLTSVDIPNGTKFKGSSDSNNSYAFGETTGLTQIKIDTDTVYSNIFSMNKNLKKVIFGENVKTVNYDWSGTNGDDNAKTLADTVDRATYVLNADTVFGMDKASGGSPFGYAKALTVVGKSKDLNGDSNAYNNTADPVTAKVAYLAQYYKTNTEVNGYAKGSAESITITAQADPSQDEGVTSTVTKNQSAIEAYYSTIIFTGKTLDKDKMTVYKMFGTTQKGKYESDEFYVLRTNDADQLLAIDQTNEKNSGNEYIATYTDDIIASYEAKDTVTITKDDLAAGTVDVKVIVLQKDANGKILVDHSNGHVIAYVYAVAIPVKEYTAENDFLENYGSYDAVISMVNDLKDTNKNLDAEIANLNQQITDKNAKISDLEAQIATKDGNIDDLNGQISILKQEKAALESDKTSLQKQLTDAEKKLSDTIQSYAKLLDATKIDKSDYIYTVTKGGETKYYVLINGEECEYDSASGKKMTVNGETVVVYTGTDKNGQPFKFYVADDGVHVVTIIQDEDGSDSIASDVVSSDTVAAMQHKIAAQLQSMKDQLQSMESALDEIGASLNIDGMDGKTDDEKVAAIKNAITVLNKKISDLEASVAAKDKQISDLQKQNGQQAATIEQANATIKNLKDQITTVNTKLSETQEALDTANRNLDTANGNLSDAQQQITTISGNLQKTENDLATAKEALAEKQTDLDAANALIESTNAALTKAQGDLSTARSDLVTVQSTLSSTQEELAATKTALETANTSLSGAQQEINSLNAEVENLRNTIAGYQSMLNSIKNALSLTSEADNTEILASISDLNARLDSLSEKIASLAALLGIDTSGKTDSAVMDEIINKVTKLTNEYDTVTKNYNKIVKKIYRADETVDVSNKSVDEVLAAIDSLSGDTSAIAKQLQEAITGKTISDSDVQEVTVLLNQVKEMKNDLDQKSNLLNEIMEALGITDSAQIIQTILDLKTQVASLQKENAELKANGSTTGGGADYTKDTEVNSSSASYTSGYNAGYSKAARDFANDSSSNNTMSAQVLALTNSNSTLTKENTELKSENKTLTDGIDTLYNQVSTTSLYSSSGTSKLQAVSIAVNNLISNNKEMTEENKTLQSENKNLSGKNKTLQKNNDSLSSKVKSLTTSKNTLSAKVSSLTSSNDKLKASEKTLKSQVSSLQSQVNSLKNSTSTSTATTNSRYTANTNSGSSNTASVQRSNASNSGTETSDSKKSESKANSSNTDKKDKTADTSEVIESDNITRNATLDSSVGVERQLGEVLETMLPETTTLASDQQAATTLNQIDDSKAVDITTNAKDTNAATSEQKNNALKIVNWYMNNLEELGNLGSQEIKDAATDSSKSVTFDMLASFDVTPSDAQQDAIDNKQDVDLTISSPDIEDGALYLVIHESDLREGTFDVALTQAYGSEIDIKVPDLSPVTLTKIIVTDAEVISSSSTQQSTEELPQEVEESNKNNSGFRVIMYFLIVVAIGGAVVLLVLAKRRKGGSSRK